MTTPEERRRNLIWARQMLVELTQDSQLSPPHRDRAAALLATYPSMIQLTTADDRDLCQLIVDCSPTFSGIRQFFMRLHLDKAVAEGRRNALLVILRHFS